MKCDSYIYLISFSVCISRFSLILNKSATLMEVRAPDGLLKYVREQNKYNLKKKY